VESATTEVLERYEEGITGESLLGTVGGVIWGFCEILSIECELEEEEM